MKQAYGLQAKTVVQIRGKRKKERKKKRLADCRVYSGSTDEKGKEEKVLVNAFFDKREHSLNAR